MLKILGNRDAALVREITKIYEETKKDSLEQLVEYYQKKKIKGEVVLLVSPPKASKKEVDFVAIDEELRLGAKKFKPKDLVAMVADKHGINKKVIYQRMLEVLK